MVRYVYETIIQCVCACVSVSLANIAYIQNTRSNRMTTEKQALADYPHPSRPSLGLTQPAVK